MANSNNSSWGTLLAVFLMAVVIVGICTGNVAMPIGLLMLLLCVLLLVSLSSSSQEKAPPQNVDSTQTTQTADAPAVAFPEKEAVPMGDPLLWDAARAIVEKQVGSTSFIQRTLSIGYNRAGHIMDQLESLGIVSPPSGSKPREVLVKDLPTLRKVLSDKERKGEFK